MYRIYTVLQGGLPNFEEGFLIEFETDDIDVAITHFYGMIKGEIEFQKDYSEFILQDIVLEKNEETFLSVTFYKPKIKNEYKSIF